MAIFDFQSAIVRSPGASVVHGQRSDPGARPTHAGIAAEHRVYVEALERAGLEVERLPALEAFPDSVFVEDPALVFPGAAIVLRPGAATRMGEAEALAPVLRDRFETVLTLDQGSVDGGDVLVTPSRVLIGLSGRTDREGAEALARLLGFIGRAAAIVEPPAGTLHLKSASSLVDEETVLVTAAMAGSGIFDGLRQLVVPEGEEAGANALRVRDTVVAGAQYPRTLELLDRPGVALVPLPIAEIARVDAGLSCMSLRW